LQAGQQFETISAMIGQRFHAPDGLDEIAERLKRTRQALGMSQAQWCRLTGIEPQAWNNYEKGIRRISLEQAIRVCQATGVTTDWIYRGLMSSGLPVNIQTALQAGPRNKR
jgi:transcriptional regulator with XRE-family HTH domain